MTTNNSNPDTCRFSGHFSPPWSERKYEHNQEFWQLWFARLAFVVAFQTGVSLCVLIVRYLVPDIPDALKQRIQREAFLCNELTIREEDLSKDNEDDEENIKQEEII